MKTDQGDKSVPREIQSLLSRGRVMLRQTHRAVTPLGGAAVFVAFLHKLGFVDKVRQHSGLFVERGEHPGAKNVSGAAFYSPQVLEALIPEFWRRAPVERVRPGGFALAATAARDPRNPGARRAGPGIRAGTDSHARPDRAFARSGCAGEYGRARRLAARTGVRGSRHHAARAPGSAPPRTMAGGGAVLPRLFFAAALVVEPAIPRPRRASD